MYDCKMISDNNIDGNNKSVISDNNIAEVLQNKQLIYDVKYITNEEMLKCLTFRKEKPENYKIVTSIMRSFKNKFYSWHSTN